MRGLVALLSSAVLTSAPVAFADAPANDEGGDAPDAPDAPDALALRVRLAYHAARETFAGRHASPDGIVVAVPLAFEARWRGLELVAVLPFAYSNATFFKWSGPDGVRDHDDQIIAWADPDSLEIGSPTLHVSYRAPVHRALVAGGGIMTTFLPSRSNDVASLAAAAFVHDPSITWTRSQTLWMHGDLAFAAARFTVRAQAGLVAYHGGELRDAQALVRGELELRYAIPRIDAWSVAVGLVALSDAIDEGVDEGDDYLQQLQLRVDRTTRHWDVGVGLGLRSDPHGRNALSFRVGRAF